MTDIYLLRRPGSILESLRPAVQTWSMVFAMLGAIFIVVTIMVAWVSTPESVSLAPFGSHAAVVRGGQTLTDVAPYLKHELMSAAELLVGGLVGMLSSRPREASPAGE